MNKTDTFEQFLATQSVQVPVLSFIINLFLAGMLAWLLSLIYTRYGNAISNRALFSRNLVLLTMTTMVVITIVKSSLALSLGLVGALSIVRFRAAIKEPEELVYLFLAISIGLGMGADQLVITITSFIMISAVIILRNMHHVKYKENTNLVITISSSNPELVSLNKITKVLNNCCEAVDLKRYDQQGNLIEAAYHTTVHDVIKLEEINEQLKLLDEEIRITFLDQSGIIA